MKRKLICLLTAFALTVTVTGCGTKDNAASNQGSVDKAQTESTVETPTENAGPPYTVTMVLHGSQQPDEERIENKINEILEKELNAKLDLVVLPWGSAAQQKRLMLSSDEKIDMLYTNVTDAAQYMKAGQIIDMTELIEQHGTNLKELYGMEVLKSNSIDGFVYGVPNQIERGSIPSIFMRKDLVEKYNIDTSAIKEPKDMEAVFEVVKAGEPNMTMLYSSHKDDDPLSRLMQGGFDNLGDNKHFGILMNQTESSEVTNVYASDWYMNTATMLHDWFNKGYINKDAGIETENWRTVFKAGNLFSIFFSYHPGTPVEFSSSTSYDFEIVPFSENPIKNSGTYSGVVFSIAQNCENPEKTMQVLDMMYKNVDIMNLLTWGEEGIDYVYVDQENDIIDYPEGITMETVGYSLNLGWELPNQFIAHAWAGSKPGIWDEMEAFNNSAEDSVALGFQFDNSGLEDKIAALSNVYEQYKGSIQSGAVDPQEYIPQYLAALESAGINDIIDAKQQQLNAWLENK